MTDTRIAYGTRCSWWDSIDKVGKTPPHNGISIPCCPHCGSPLFEVPDEQSWFAGVDKHDAKNPGYRAFVEWLRGRCFPNYQDARAVYDRETQTSMTTPSQVYLGDGVYAEHDGYQIWLRTLEGMVVALDDETFAALVRYEENLRKEAACATS